MLNRHRPKNEALLPAASRDVEQPEWVPLAVIAAELGEMGLSDAADLARYLGEDRVHRLRNLVHVVSPAALA